MWKSPDIKNILALFGYSLIYTLSATCRVTVVGRAVESTILADGVSPIYTFWHGRLFYFPYHYRNNMRYNILVSPSKDGEVIGNVLQRFGFGVVWGSTFKRGAMALLALVRKVKKGESVVLIADGSRGPLYTLQPGALGVARMTGAPVIPMTFSSNRKKVFASWDKFLLPLPFSKIVVIYGKPTMVPREVSTEMINSLRLELENELKKITREADSFFEKEGVRKLR